MEFFLLFVALIVALSPFAGAISNWIVPVPEMSVRPKWSHLEAFDASLAADARAAARHAQRAAWLAGILPELDFKISIVD